MTNFYRITFKLLKNYRALKDSLKHGNTAQSLCDQKEIKESLQKTKKYLEAVDNLFLERKQSTKGTNKEMEVVAAELYFLEGYTYEHIAELLDVSENTPRRWITRFTQDLTIRLFAIDGFKEIYSTLTQAHEKEKCYNCKYKSEDRKESKG